MNIFQINTADFGGGAERVAVNLHQAYLKLRNEAWLAVGTKKTNLEHIIRLNPEEKKGHVTIKKIFNKNIFNVYNYVMGREDFAYPGIWDILNRCKISPEIIQCHNLHGNYFDLRSLPRLSKEYNVVITLHDAWLTTGHCAHTFSCNKWISGCGDCPDLSIYPAVLRDSTKKNWQEKKRIFENSEIFLSTPCNWLMEKANKSLIKSSIVDSRVIPNGVDLAVFYPKSRKEARKTLKLPQDTTIILFTANGIRNNIWKDFLCLQESIRLLGEKNKNKKIICLALGENAPDEIINGISIQFIPYQTNHDVTANYYNASDIYVHPTRADTFPNTILEALACGVPVVASDIGGIPEQIIHGVTGFLTEARDAQAMSEKIDVLIKDDRLRKKMGLAAAEDAQRRFDLNHQALTYVNWFEEIISKSNS